MTESFDVAIFEPLVDPIALAEEPPLLPSSDPSCEFAPTAYEGSTNVQPPIWQPTDPQFTKAIAEYYGVSRKTVQEWFQKVKEACPWFSHGDLKLPDDRYTPLAVSLMGSYRTSGLSFKTWKARIWKENSDLAVRFQTPGPFPPSAQAGTATEGIPHHNGNATPCSGMVLHSGSNPALPLIPSIVPAGNDTEYLTQMQQRLQAFEQLQQQAISQMQAQYQQAQALNFQYHEAMNLSDQLLLQEFQLKGVQLGYAALRLKQQAFKSAIQSAESGSFSMLGKPQSESVEPSSV
ncbi:hypothetical protein H6F89_04115 [Cyanobacteria bacterium FACHB-63]|nr:hypothetical protein [Cyanobacteria bacterium FACHB-63]